ncbi:HAD hydrolase-like protein [Thermodesulfobacteriota bacterium]
MGHSYVVGDRHTDIEFANRSNVKGVLVKTGYGLGETKYILPESTTKAEYIAGDLLEAVTWILEREKK